MRFTRYIPLATFLGAMLLAPVSAPAAGNKDMEELQRDVAQLQDQVSALTKNVDTKIGALQSAVQQLLDTANKTSSSVNSLNSGVTQTMQSELRGVKDQLSSVNGLSVKVDNASNDISDLHTAVAGLVVTVNKEQQQLNDISNQIKLLQAPAAPPPGADASGAGPGTAMSPPPSPGTLFTNATRDQNSGNTELALSEYQQFLHLYPDDGNASGAQYNIGDIYYGQGKTDEAVKAYDAAIEQYPKDDLTTPKAYFMKGMALKKEKKNAAAIASFQAVVKEFPHTEEASQARTQLTTMGAPVAPKRPAR
jgi:TolA-binding protein